jgi:hypothetical protein
MAYFGDAHAERPLLAAQSGHSRNGTTIKRPLLAIFIRKVRKSNMQMPRVGELSNASFCRIQRRILRFRFSQRT